MGESRVLVSMVDGVAVITLNRPDARNALSWELVRELDACLRRLGASGEVGACVLTGAGKAFCAGADLKERTGMSPDELVAHTQAIRECTDLVAAMPVPMIAAVNGPAYAGGMELAIACDIRIASDGASFALPEVKLGIFPGAGGPLRLPGIVGRGWARLMVFGGEPIDSREALRIGLVERLVPADRLMAEAMAVARGIAAHRAEGVRAAKRLMRAAEEMTYEEAARLSDEIRAPLNRAAQWQAGLAKRDRQGQ